MSQAPTIDFANLVCAASATSGGAGTVRQVISPRQFWGFSELYIKEFNPARVSDGAREKLVYQIEHSPAKLVAARFRLAWPIGLVTAGNTRLGFLMPGAFPNSMTLEELVVPTLAPNVQQPFRDKFDSGQPSALLNRIKAALNICAALRMFYSGGEYQIIDMKPNNILITPGGEITLVDLDSIQILERGSVKFEGVDGTDRYKPPEGLGDRVDPFHKNIHWDEFSLAVILYQIIVGAPPHAASFGGAFARCTEMRDKIKSGLFVFGRHESIITNRSPLHDTFKRLPTEVQQLFLRALDLGHDNPSIRPSVVDWGGALYRAVNLLDSQLKLRPHAKNPVIPSPFPILGAIAACKLVLASAMQRWRAMLLISGGLVGLFLLSIGNRQNPTPVYHQPQSYSPPATGPAQHPGSSARSSPLPQQTIPQPSFVAPPPGYEWFDQSRGLKRWMPGSAYGPRWPHVIASQQEGKWTTERGYQFRNNIAVWVPGSAYGPPRPHVIASNEEGKWEPEPGYEFLNNGEGEYGVRPIPEPAASYDQGLTDRTAWEQWFTSLSGDFQAGAYWWSGQRSLPNPGACNTLAASQQFVMGCEAGKARLTPTDARRTSSAEYKRGWNEYSGPVAQPQIPDPQPNVIPPNGDAPHDPDVGADRLNSQELRRLMQR